MPIWSASVNRLPANTGEVMRNERNGKLCRQFLLAHCRYLFDCMNLEGTLYTQMFDVNTSVHRIWSCGRITAAGKKLKSRTDCLGKLSH